MLELTGPTFVTLLVANLEVSRRFYLEQVGLKESADKRHNALLFDTKPCGLAIRQVATETPKTPSPSNGLLVWFHTKDAAAFRDQLKARGVRISRELEDGPFGRNFFFEDPDGYNLCVYDGGA